MTGTHWGRVIGHARNRENRHQQHHENRSAHVAVIGTLMLIKMKDIIIWWYAYQLWYIPCI